MTLKQMIIMAIIGAISLSWRNLWKSHFFIGRSKYNQDFDFEFVV